MKPTVVILLSDKRSGSTMFERELCRHGGIRHIDYCPHSYNETHHWLKAAVLLDLPGYMFSEGKVYPGYGSRKNARTYLLDGISGNVPDFEVPADDRALVFDGWEALCAKYARPVFFEKSPQHLAHWGALALMLEWAGNTEFDVKFIGLVRNPLAVMYSAGQLFGTDPQTRQFGWVEIQRNLLAFRQMIQPEQYLQLRYEDLIADPLEEFGKVCDFIGVERDPRIGEEVHSHSVDKWGEDEHYGLELDQVVVRMAEHFGYSAGELKNNHAETVDSNAPIGPGVVDRTKAKIRNRWFKPLLMKLRKKRGG